MKIGLLLALVWLGTEAVIKADEHMDSFKVGSEVYSNVTIYSVTKTDVFFSHKRGMGNAKLKDLDSSLQKHFHYQSGETGAKPVKPTGGNVSMPPSPPRVIPQPRIGVAAKTSARLSNPDEAGTDEDMTTVTRVGDDSPVMSMRTIDGKIISFTNRVVVVDLFATWCGPCLVEIPQLEKQLWSQLKERGGLVIGAGREHSEVELQAFRKRIGITFPIVADTKREIYDRFATKYIPRCILIGKDGKIKFQSVGASEKDFAELVAATFVELKK